LAGEPFYIRPESTIYLYSYPYHVQMSSLILDIHDSSLYPAAHA
jgi:hypothetical protein